MRAEAALAVVFLTAAGAWAGPVQVRVAPERATVGDRVEVTVTVPPGAGWTRLEMDPAGDGRWAVVEAPRREAPGRWRLVLAPLEVGRLELPPLVAVQADGGRTAVTETGTVEVVSVLPPGGREPEPAPLRDPVGVEGPPWEWFPVAALLLVPAAVAAALWRRRRRPGTRAGRESRCPPLPELEAELSAARRELGEVPAAMVCDRVAAAVRRYLERALGEPAAEMTTREIVRLARHGGWPPAAARGVARALEIADRVRYARAAVPRVQLEGAIAGALEGARALEAWRAARTEAAA